MKKKKNKCDCPRLLDADIILIAGICLIAAGHVFIGLIILLWYYYE
jgi:hypothetical protein